MLKQSVFIKPLLLLLVLCLSVTLISVAVTKGRTGSSEKVNIPTETDTMAVETETGEAETLPDHSGDVVATNHDATVMCRRREDTGMIQFMFGVDGLEPNTTYELSWIIGSGIDTPYYGIHPAFCYYTGSDFSTTYLLNRGNLYSNKVIFKTPDYTDGFTLYFIVAQGDWENCSESYETMKVLVAQEVVFTLAQK